MSKELHSSKGKHLPIYSSAYFGTGVRALPVPLVRVLPKSSLPPAPHGYCPPQVSHWQHWALGWVFMCLCEEILST